MHASSLENMAKCYRRYIAGGSLELGFPVVLDVGGANVNGSYRDLFPGTRFEYRAADLAAGPGVDIVLEDPYRLPFADRSVDIVLSGQALEHTEYFWRAFTEMVRVLSPDGFVFLIVPSGGPIHRFPVDCYRFYPDALPALARLAEATLVDSWLDERGPWRDLVGVFRRKDAPPLGARAAPPAFAPGYAGALGTAAQEVARGEAPYLSVLRRVHVELRPEHYLEIGVRKGASLSLAVGPATGVDPAPAIESALPETTRVVTATSDDFFEDAAHASLRADLFFIDGMHLVEYALRDFMHCERRATAGAVVFIDDVLPNHPAQADRERRTRHWTGDVFRFVGILRRYRPDLFQITLDTSPTGLLLIAGLDPANRVLWDSYNPILRWARGLESPSEDVLTRREAVSPTGPEFGRVLETLSAVRAEGASPHEIVARLRAAASVPAPIAVLAPVAPRLSVVVAGYNMARELPRTLRSLSPSMQKDVTPLDYEVIVVDNGSKAPADDAELRRILPGVVLRRVEDGGVSPVRAINLGLSLSRADLVGVFIDGARMASPRLLSRALAASKLHPRPVIGALAFHLGPEVQMDSVKRGYDRKVEDGLLAAAAWEEDGYRLFEISVPAASSEGGWFELPAETNSLFLRKDHWAALGGYDPRFETPGGGLVNLDTWARACADPDAEVILLLGEATFHQFHGGVATNLPDPPHEAFAAEYERLRGRPYSRPTRRPTFFGAFDRAAVVSRAFSIDCLRRSID